MERIIAEKFNPYIISIRYFNGKIYDEGMVFPVRKVYDYEIEYIIDGNGCMVVDGVKNQLQSGMTFFRRPHQENYGIMPYECYLVVFDAAGNCKNNSDQFTVCKNRYQPLHEIDIPIPPVTKFYYKEKVESILRIMHMEYMQANPFKQLLLKSYFFQLISEIISVNMNQSIDYPLNITPMIQKRIERCIEYIKENYKNELDINKLASEAKLSSSHFHRIFKLATGESPIQYAINLRLNEAKRLLVQTEYGIKEVCYECGFDDPSYFCKIFKQKTGLTPLAFRDYFSHRFL